jgi:teichuronic acid biosynthesis glycosyltransferase TuaH
VPDSASDGCRDVVLVLSSETWDDAALRGFARPPDRLAQFLLASPRVRRLLVVNPWRNRPRQVLRRVAGRRSAPFPTHADHHLLRPMLWTTSTQSDPRSLSDSYARYSAAIDRGVQRRGLVDPVLFSFNPLHVAFGQHQGFASVTYFARDDWAKYHNHRHLWPVYEQSYELMREAGVGMAAVSRELLDRLAPRGPGLVLPNGVEPAVWNRTFDEPPEFKELTRPIAVYAGTIDERLSLPALRSTSERVGSLVLVGPAKDPMAGQLADLAPKVVLLRARPQPELAPLVAAADVCVLPHVRNALTTAMSPLKVYEYLAAGARVVATDLPPVRDIHPTVGLVAEFDEFGEAVSRALDAPRMTEEERMRFVQGNSWSSRFAGLLDMAYRT